MWLNSVVPRQHPWWCHVSIQGGATSPASVSPHATSAAGVAMPRGIAFNDGSGHQL